jgi:hypothetical protein
MTAMRQNCDRILESRFSNSAAVQFEFIEWHSTFESIRSSLASAHPATGGRKGLAPPSARCALMWCCRPCASYYSPAAACA